MNIFGKKYLENNKPTKEFKSWLSNLSGNPILERTMRLGIETIAFELDKDEYEKIATATLVNDFNKRYAK